MSQEQQQQQIEIPQFGGFAKVWVWDNDKEHGELWCGGVPGGWLYRTYRVMKSPAGKKRGVDLEPTLHSPTEALCFVPDPRVPLIRGTFGVQPRGGVIIPQGGGPRPMG